MKRIAVWGTGLYLEQLMARGCLKDYDISVFCDNDVSKQGAFFYDKPVVSPNELTNWSFDAVYIASIEHYDEIKKQIIESKLALENQIYEFPTEKDKYAGELSYWQAIYKKEGNCFHNDSYKNLMLSIAEEKDDSFWSNKVVADFGCGPRGSLTWSKTPLLRIGIDVLAEKYAANFSDEIKKHEMVYVTSTENLIPMPDECVDYLLTINSLDHVNNLDEIICELHRILKKGGILLGSFNLNEPYTEYEPQTLTESIIDQKLLKHFKVNTYRLAYKNKNDTYENLRNNKLINCTDGRESILWVKAVKK